MKPARLLAVVEVGSLLLSGFGWLLAQLLPPSAARLLVSVQLAAAILAGLLLVALAVVGWRALAPQFHPPMDMRYEVRR